MSEIATDKTSNAHGVETQKHEQFVTLTGDNLSEQISLFTEDSTVAAKSLNVFQYGSVNVATLGYVDVPEGQGYKCVLVDEKLGQFDVTSADFNDELADALNQHAERYDTICHSMHVDGDQDVYAYLLVKK